MSEITKFTPIPDDFITKKGVQALSNRPNVSTQYGKGGLNAQGLKEWFDNLGKGLIERVTELQNAINGDDAAKYFGVKFTDSNGTAISELEAYKTLADIIDSFQNGMFAEKLLKLKSSVSETELQTLQTIINSMASGIAKVSEGKLDKYDPKEVFDTDYKVYAVGQNTGDTVLDVSLTSSPSPNTLPIYDTGGRLKVNPPEENNDATTKAYVDNIGNDLSTDITELSKKVDNCLKMDRTIGRPRVYAVSVLGNQEKRYLAATPASGEIPIYSTNGCIAVNEPKSDSDATPKSYVESRLEEMGTRISCDMNTTEYKLYVNLLNEKDNLLSQGIIDLPLESMVVGATYSNKKLTITLQNGNTTDIDVSDLVSGLVNESTYNEDQKALSDRIGDVETYLKSLQRAEGSEF